jgi:hypothetical protein
MRGSVGTRAVLAADYAVSYTQTAVLELNMNRYSIPLYTERESILKASISNITANGTTITVTANNNFSAGQTVTITGSNATGLPNKFNITAAIASASSTQFTITSAITGTYLDGGVATVDEAYWTRSQYDTYLDSIYGDNDDIGSQKMLSLLFPISSCVSPSRPKAGGLVKLLKGAPTRWMTIPQWDALTTSSAGYNAADQSWTLPPRHALTSTEQPYKYYLAGYTAAGARITSAYVQYKDPVWANKIDIVFENTFSKPRTYSIDLRINGSWTTVYSVSNTDLTASDGRLTIWNTNNNRGATPNGTWGLVAPSITPVYSSGLDYCRAVSGIRVNVSAVAASSVGNFSKPEQLPGHLGSRRRNLSRRRYCSGWNSNIKLWND